MKSRRAGLTLVELVMAVALVGVALGSLTMVSESTNAAYRTSTVTARIEADGRRVLTRIKRLLREAGDGTITPTIQSPFTTDALNFQRAVGIADGGTVWGPLQRIELQYMPGEIDDGLDNNSNGLVDECRVVWIERFGEPDARENVLGTLVPELLQGELPNVFDDNANGLADETGLCFEFDGDLVAVAVTLMRVDAEGLPMTRTFEATINPRN